MESLLRCDVHSAGIQYRDGACRLFGKLTMRFPFLQIIFVDSAYAGGKVEKAAIRLLSTVIEWSRKRISREVMIHVTSGIDIQRTDRFLRRARFKVIGANYAFALGKD